MKAWSLLNLVEHIEVVEWFRKKRDLEKPSLPSYSEHDTDPLAIKLSKKWHNLVLDAEEAKDKSSKEWERLKKAADHAKEELRAYRRRSEDVPSLVTAGFNTSGQGTKNKLPGGNHLSKEPDRRYPTYNTQNDA